MSTEFQHRIFKWTSIPQQAARTQHDRRNDRTATPLVECVLLL